MEDHEIKFEEIDENLSDNDVKYDKKNLPKLIKYQIENLKE